MLAGPAVQRAHCARAARLQREALRAGAQPREVLLQDLKPKTLPVLVIMPGNALGYAVRCDRLPADASDLAPDPTAPPTSAAGPAYDLQPGPDAAGDEGAAEGFGAAANELSGLPQPPVIAQPPGGPAAGNSSSAAAGGAVSAADRAGYPAAGALVSAFATRQPDATAAHAHDGASPADAAVPQHEATLTSAGTASPLVAGARRSASEGDGAAGWQLDGQARDHITGSAGAAARGRLRSASGGADPAAFRFSALVPRTSVAPRVRERKPDLSESQVDAAGRRSRTLLAGCTGPGQITTLSATLL